MPGDAQRVTKPTLLSLVRGIIDDAKQLVIGQYEFRKYQTLRQVAKARTMFAREISAIDVRTVLDLLFSQRYR